jgi:3-oxoacyl-[acyl-carrier-protein] synthase-3
MSKYSRITGTGSYLPPKVFTNAEWEKIVDTSSDWIIERTGIQSRHFAAENESTVTMGVKACQKALEQADLAASDIDMVIMATGLPEKLFPASACLIQAQLGIPTCIAFDIQAACTGFIYALSIADQYIKSGMIKNALVVGSEIMSRLIDWSDRNTCVLFGDGAGAVVLSASDTPGVLSTNLYAEGKYSELLKCDNLQNADCSDAISSFNPGPKTGKKLDQFEPFIYMEGRKVFKLAVTMLGKMVEDIQTQHNLEQHQIDWLVPHQANIRIITATAEKLGLPMDKVIITNDTHGNTSAASIPLALDVAVRDGRIKPGQMLLFEAFGAGLTWGSALIQF